MYTLVADPETTQQLDALQRAEERMLAARERQLWKETLAAKMDLIPQLLSAAELIEKSWFQLSPEKQDLVVHAKRTLEDSLKAQFPKSFGGRLKAIVKSVWALSYEQEALQFSYALTRFMIAVDRAVASEARHWVKASEYIAKSKMAQADIERGETEYRAGVGRAFTEEEFRDRFNFG
jgi:hypothetical protein